MGSTGTFDSVACGLEDCDPIVLTLFSLIGMYRTVVGWCRYDQIKRSRKASLRLTTRGMKKMMVGESGCKSVTEKEKIYALTMRSICNTEKYLFGAHIEVELFDAVAATTKQSE